MIRHKTQNVFIHQVPIMHIIPKRQAINLELYNLITNN